MNFAAMALHDQLSIIGAAVLLGGLIGIAHNYWSDLRERRRAKRVARLAPIFDPIVIRRMTK